MWIFWTYNLIFSKSQWCLMGYGLWTNPWISIQCLDLEEDFFQCIIMCLNLQVHKSGKVGCGLNYEIYGRWKNFLNLDIHEDEIVKWALWAFGFGGSYVSTTLLYHWYFPYDDVITTWSDEKTRKGIMVWFIFASLVVH